MKKKIFLSVFIAIGIFAGGCSNENSKESTKNEVNQLIDTTDNTKNNDNNSEDANKAQENLKVQEIWSGNWQKGQGGTEGASGAITISEVNEKQFKFSLNASFVTKSKDAEGKEFLNPHEGQIQGIAYLNSNSEAYYTDKEFPDYKMIFTSKGKTISVQEVNTKTNDDYGSSPNAGVNVRFSGDYSKKQ
ncbi:hypothetical protein [Clostridium cellulovorans]|uniref:Lipoprotein n=1 Tax=Clostridium cellulovorans (strain ATCC 35296 / DSM 3052 / OCM 3 / 743B) TaxID=573061 RepID=D9SU28_CLOC7|nr:hypothetical protein [Clostridium cellulovorans]ADL50866.1 hypothetical protein Clocel_1107 [Clostridium cellulovorans 743B]